MVVVYHGRAQKKELKVALVTETGTKLIPLDGKEERRDIDRTASLRSVYIAIQLTWFGKNPLDWRKDSRTERDGHGWCSGGEWQSIATLDYAEGVKRTLGTGYLLVLGVGY